MSVATCDLPPPPPPLIEVFVLASGGVEGSRAFGLACRAHHLSCAAATASRSTSHARTVCPSVYTHILLPDFDRPDSNVDVVVEVVFAWRHLERGRSVC